MRVSLSYRIAANIDACAQSYWDEAFSRAKFEALGASNIDIEVAETADGGYHVTSSREVPMDAPAMLQAVIGERSTVRQTEHWDGKAGGPYVCQLEVQPEGVPAHAKGTITITKDGDGCVLECETDAICTMPLVGRMAEKFMAADIEKRLDEEVDYIEGNV